MIAGGGTGGHIYPGLAVAEAVRAAHPDAAVIWVGGDRLEARVVPLAGVQFIAVLSRGLPRRIGVRAVEALLVNAVGAVQALDFLRRFRPAGVLLTGGYAAAPVGAAAVLLRVPVLLHEPNALPGLTTRLLARWAWRVAVGQAATAAHFPGKAVVTGVPLRPGILDGVRDRGVRRFDLAGDRVTALVLGGSQGAHAINQAVLDALPALRHAAGLQIFHQTGEAHAAVAGEAAARLGESAGLRYVARPYIEEMADAYAAADLVVCRAGAVTLAEVTALGRPAILVPYPHAAEAHQERNARAVADAGGAVMILNRDLTGDRLAQAILDLARDPARRAVMAAGSRTLGRPRATAVMLALVEEMVGAHGG